MRDSQNGWVKAGDGGWYFYENGQLKTGWLYRNGNWYWLDPDRNGRMAENSWFTYDNNLYYAKGDGAIYKNGFQEVDGNLYYFQSWGGIQRNVYLSISGKMYYVQENGIVARGIVRTMNGHGDLCAFDDTTGAQITQKGWLKKGTSYYWVREDGCKMLGPYIMCAANLNRFPRGTTVESSLGTCLVCDTGGFAASNPTQLDIATNW